MFFSTFNTDVYLEWWSQWFWLVCCRKQGMLTQGPTPDSKCKLNISSLFTLPLCEKCPNTKFFLVRIFRHTDRIQKDTPDPLHIQSNCSKIGTTKNSVFWHFSPSVPYSLDCFIYAKDILIIVLLWADGTVGVCSFILGFGWRNRGDSSRGW